LGYVLDLFVINYQLDLLKNGGMVSSKLQELVIEQVGCSERTFKTACAELELKKYQAGRQWFTVLSDEG